MLTEQDIDRIKGAIHDSRETVAFDVKLSSTVEKAVDKALDARRTIAIEDHRDHHAWIALQIERQRTREKRWEAVRRQVIGWGVVAMLAAIGTASYKWVIHFIKQVSATTGGG